MLNFGYIPVFALRFMVLYFIVTNAIAMALFPGGTLFNPQLEIYSFSEIFLVTWESRLRKMERKTIFQASYLTVLYWY